MRTSVQVARPEHEIAYNELAALVSRHAADISALELLAVAANMIGKLVAMQDQRVVSVEMAMELIAHNIEEGNRQVVAGLQRTEGTA